MTVAFDGKMFMAGKIFIMAENLKVRFSVIFWRCCWKYVQVEAIS